MPYNDVGHAEYSPLSPGRAAGASALTGRCRTYFLQYICTVRFSYQQAETENSPGILILLTDNMGLPGNGFFNALKINYLFGRS